MTHLYYATYLLALLVFKTDACLFPSELEGQWLSSMKGVLNFTSSDNITTNISGYRFNEFGAVDLTCFTSSGDSYVFQSSTFRKYNLEFAGYVCFILYRQSEAKYTYNIGSVWNSDAKERIKTILTSTTTPQTVASVCDRASYHTGSEHMFLKNDGNEENEKIYFPYSLRGTYSYTFNSGNGDLCGATSDLNICSSPDFSTLMYNYTLCSTIQAYSAIGQLYLMYYVTDSSNNYYMTVYNTDTTTDESATYRFTCYVIQDSGTTMYATQYPRECAETQNTTYVASPGATLVLTQKADCPFDTTSTVVSTAATAAIVIGVLLFIALIVCGALVIWHYKKRTEKDARDKLPVQKSQPANKRLANGDMFKDSKRKDSNTPKVAQNGDVKINMDDISGSIRREDSICLSVASRGPSVLPQLSETASRNGPAPVEEPEKVNDITNSAIEESDLETTLASTFLPISTADKQLLNFSPRDIEEKEKENKKKEEIDMDDIDDELGLPRLSRAAFTPVVDPEPAPLPVLIFKKPEVETESEEERTKDGIKKVKLKKIKKKHRVTSAKGRVKSARPKSATKQKTGKGKEFPFLERIKKEEKDSTLIEVKPLSESRQSAAKLIGTKTPDKAPDSNDEVKRARSGKGSKKARPKTGSKYVVDSARDQRLRPPDKGALRATSGEQQRRRFGDLPTSSNRKRTPRLRHPMEVQGDGEEIQDQKEVRQKEVAGQEEKRTRSGRRRGNPEGSAIPSVKEDPFDYRDRPFTTSTLATTRNGKSAGLRLDRENSAFIEPPKKPQDVDVWNKVSNMWIFKNQPSFGNIGHK